MNRTKTLILLLTLFSLSLVAQQEDDSWFSQKKSNPTRPNAPPPPGVPLDGGLIGLIAAGGALGYKKYKQRNSNYQDDFKA